MTNKKTLRVAVLSAFLAITMPFSLAHGYSNYLPSPFPLCTMDGKTKGMKGEIDAVYSNVKTDTMDLDLTGIRFACVRENPEALKPSFHITVHGEIIDGDLESQGLSAETLRFINIMGYGVYVSDDVANQADIEGYALGASITPSFVLTDRFKAFRPSFFLGTNVQYQKMDIDWEEIIDQMNSSDWTRPTYNPFTGINLTMEKETVQIGGHAGITLDFSFGSNAFSSFFMTQIVKGRAHWKYEYNQEDENMRYTSTVQAFGLGFRLAHPGVSILSMVQFVNEEDAEEEEVYSVMAGVSF